MYKWWWFPSRCARFSPPQIWDAFDKLNYVHKFLKFKKKELECKGDALTLLGECSDLSTKAA